MKTKPTKLFTAACLFANLFLAIVIVLLNKWLYVHIQFPNLTLTFTHFVMTYVGLELCQRSNVFQVKRIPVWNMLPLAVTFCGFVVFTNLSLGYNTVGTYQLIKTLTMPSIMIIQTYCYGKHFTRNIKFTLIPLLLGVILNSCYDVKFNFMGTLFAIIGVVVTSLYQVWVGEKQKEFQVNSMQLLYYQAPLSAMLLVLLIPFVEPPWRIGGVLAHSWSAVDLFVVALSGVTAFGINLSIYWIIGNTSAVTYNVVGQLKFCLTLLGGYYVFKDSIHSMQILGIVVTFVGVILYSYYRLRDATETPRLPLTEKAQLK